MTSRIHRGFVRIGIVLAVPLLAISAFEAGYELWWGWRTHKAYAEYLATVAGGASTTDPFDRLALDSLAPHVAAFSMPLVLLAIAIALYVAARAVGWVLAGFLGSGSRPL